MVDEHGVIEYEWDIDPSDSALLVIDMQSGFLDLDGTFGQADGGEAFSETLHDRPAGVMAFRAAAQDRCVARF